MKARQALAAAVCVAFMLSACSGARSPGASEPETLNVYTWSDYFLPEVLDDFERETGTKVRLALFPSQEVVEATMLTGHSGYDVVVVGANQIERLGQVHVFREIDRARLSNWGNLDPDILERLAIVDAGNRHAVPYSWGTTGIALNLTKLRQIAPDVAFDTWQQLFDPAIMERVSKCGVSFVDSPSELVAVALMADGHDPNTTDPALFEAADRKLMGIRPYVRKIDSDMQIADLASGEICLMVTWPANYVGGRRRAAEAGGKDEYRYVIPREGTDSWIDTLAIPADAPHVAAAHAFINFMMRPAVAARGANFLGNATANQAAVEQIDRQQRDDTGIYPPPPMRAKLVPLRSRADAANRSVTRIWTHFRTEH